MIHGGETREANAVIGGKEQGKSTFTNEEVIKMYAAAGEQVIILTETEPKAYAKYKRIKSLKSLAHPNCPKVVKYYDSEDAFRMLKDIYQLCAKKQIRSGLLVLEDATNYLDPWPVKEIRQLLTNHRMFHLDIIITSHSLDLFPKFCRKMVSSVTIFQTSEVYEKPAEMKALKYGNYKELYRAWTKCMATPRNKRSYIQYHETIETGV